MATSAVFFTNGAVLAIWATNIPGMRQALRLSDSELGVVLSAFAAGTMLMMCLAGALVTRIGSRKALVLGGVLVSAVLPFCGLAGSAWALAAAVFALGIANSILDVAMNTHGSLVEARRGRPLMSSFHAVFSIGGLAGASAVASLLSSKLGLMHCLALSAVMTAVVTLIASFWLADLRPYVDVGGDCRPVSKPKSFAWPNRTLLCIAGLTFLALFIERTVIDWSSLYLTDVSHTSASIAAFAFGAFSFAMAIGRLAGDVLIRKFGPNIVVTFSGGVGALGIALTVLFPVPLASIAGFILVGVGLSNMTPLLYSQASKAYPGAPGLGLAMNGTLGYTGFLLAPPVIGYLAESYGLKLSMIIPFVAFVLLMGSHLRKVRLQRLKAAPLRADLPFATARRS
ncbi:MAG TPA: MFS transporter [Pseudomonas sp.]|uniref:MFS transporter n=1 Tax=Pseudomonas sp. TaxID=306 RepID=UPI002B496F42|nr:MFS transporter [Pseudomonas sp.]HKS12577.1 MFS transporter [Pseudomonas sp.]